uniref:BET1-like protein n=1 Tax=Moschus moschiferus TaxID=68415 RepID=A0A8C6CQW7_MOSMO
MGFSRQEYWSGLPLPSPVDTIVASKNTNHPGDPRANASPIPKSNDRRNRRPFRFPPRSLSARLGRKWEASGGRGGAGSRFRRLRHVRGGCERAVADPRSELDAMADWARAQSPGAVEEMLDRENKRMADSLASKVTRLKSLALDIDRDAEDQNRYLDGMDSDFTSMTGLLTGSVKRFSTVARSGRDNRKLLCGAAVGLLVVFFILSYLLSRART